MRGPFSRARRRLIGGASALMLSRSVPAFAWAGGRVSRADEDAIEACACALLPDPASASHIGRAYLDAHGGDADPAVLRRAILDGLAPAVAARAQAGDDGALHRWLAAQIRAEFARTRVVQVRGWMLAETEARLCALIHLRRAGKRLSIAREDVRLS